ncbi:MAG: hypothetical protein M3362_08725 [Acidobacteriota bacterium]|nr:hypothetical protein [Acidobacteriota bacterium]
MKAEFQGVGSSSETGTQVLRKSTVQTTFKELYELEVNSLVIRPIHERQRLPKIKNIHDLLAMKEILLADGWIVDPEKMVRGQLLEVEVQLEAEDIFRVSSVVSAFLDIIEANPEMFGVEVSNVIQAKTMGRILEKLLVGLVPISGLATDYKIVKLEEKEWIVHRKLLSEISEIETFSTYPLYVVGVAEQSLFWKDVRRILFSKARFRVLCRLAQSSIKDTWTPVKLAHILDMVKPGLGNEIDNLGSVVLASMVNAGKTDQNADRKRLMRDALVRYAVLLAEHYGRTIDEEELTRSGILTERQCNSFGSLEERRKAFNAIATFLRDSLDLKLDQFIVAQYRAVALMDAGLDLLGRPMPFVVSGDASSIASSEKRFLDSEFVAIYW